jgi:tetratricopeptide (TPR) repeat protein
VAAWYANLLIREGYYEQALEQAQRAVDLDPISPARRTGLAYEALRARDYDLAIDQARAAQTLEAGVMLPRYLRALALILSDRTEECLELDLGPHAGIRAICLHAQGRVEEAEAMADSLRAFIRAEERVDPDYTKVIPAGDLAAYLAWTGSPERALPWIRRAFALSPSGIDVRVLESGIFENLLTDSELWRAVAAVREGVWARVQGELADAEIRLFEGDR